MSWEKVKLSECCISISDGDHQPPPKASAGIPFVTISNINSENQFDFESVMYVPIEYYEKLDSKRKAQKNDILYSVVGSFGIPVFIKNDTPIVFQRHIAILRPDTKVIEPRFLYYTMLNRDFYMKADAVALGAAQRTISLMALRNMEINMPSLGVQRRIVEILKPYDDLIENNRKQIKLLEEMAQRLYKEWFVDLHFPGYEEVEIVDGVPEGWGRKKIGEVVATLSGGTPSRNHAEYYENGTHLWLKTKELNDGYIFDTEEKITDEGVKKSSAKFFKKGSIVLAMYGATIGKIGIATRNMTCNQACCVFDISTFDNGKEYLYCWLINHRSFLISQGKGAAQSNLSQQMIKKINIVIPNGNLLKIFSEIMNPCFELKKKLQRQNMELSINRNCLLTNFLSGKFEL